MQSRIELKSGNIGGATKHCDNIIQIIDAHQLPVDGKLLHHRVGALLLDVQYDRTQEFIEKSVFQAREAKNHQLEGCLLQLQCLISHKKGESNEAIRYCEESLRAFEAIEFVAGVEAARKLKRILTAE